MGQSLADLAINLTANIAGFTSDLGRASREAKKRSEDMARQFRQLGGAIAGALSARAFVGFIKGSIDAADRMRDLSKQFGVSVSNLSQYQSAIQKSGSSLEALARGFKFFSKEASEGSKALEAMGIEARNADGSVKDLNALFDEVAEKFKKIVRDKNGEISKEDRKEILKELGDVLWYITLISKYLGYDLEAVGKMKHFDGSFGEHWSIEQTSNLATQNNLKVNKYDYCMIRLPGIRNFLSCITFMVAPCEITWVTSSIHSCPAGGSIKILEQDGSGEGGTWLLLQFAGSLQFPVPVNV